MIRKLFPKARIVAIVRDGRDVAVSFAYHFKRRGRPDKFDARGKLEPKYLEEVARAWSVYNEHVQSFAATNDERFFLTKYEDLLTRPEEVLQDMFKSLNVDSSLSVIQKVTSRNSFEALSRGRQPGEQDERSFFRKGVAGDWVNHFGDQETSIFEAHAGTTLRSYGYGVVV